MKVSAFDADPAKRAKVLATYPDNLKGLALADSPWWAANRAKTVERFNDWLLS